MGENLVLVPEAKRDFDEAYAWYEERFPGRGEEFRSRVKDTLYSIRNNPGMFRVIREPYRRALVRGFPYAIIYEYSDNSIVVYAVFHCSQDPEKWQARLN
jgi:plasmid stabilization system protein ParE